MPRAHAVPAPLFFLKALALAILLAQVCLLCAHAKNIVPGATPPASAHNTSARKDKTGLCQTVSACRKAAEQGNAWAQDKLASMYYAGQGVAQDYTQALFWYRKAAEQGNVDAQNNLGMMYDMSYGVTWKPGQNASWYHKAAEQGKCDTRQ